jgi:hypothetical protein
MWSRTIEALPGFVAFSLLAVGCGYAWLAASTPRHADAYAAVCGAALALGTLTKLFGSAAIVAWLVIVAQVWRHDRARARRGGIVSLAAFVVVSVAILLPFIGSWHGLWEGVVTMHTDAATHYHHTIALYGPLRSTLGLAALAGVATAVLRRDGNVVAPLVWLAAVAAELALNAPLLPGHLIALSAPLIALAVTGLAPQNGGRLVVGALVLIMVAAASAAVADLSHFRHGGLPIATNASPVSAANPRLAALIDRLVPPGGLVVTDEPFNVDLANRSIPPWLVDTSIVRFTSGHLTNNQLISAASQPGVRAVLLYRGIGIYHPLYEWARAHMRLIQSYGPLGALFVARER